MAETQTVRRSARVVPKSVGTSMNGDDHKEQGKKRSRASSDPKSSTQAQTKGAVKKRKAGNKKKLNDQSESCEKALATQTISSAASQRVDGSNGSSSHWLLKAEPESRIEKGQDVKFSIDDLAACTEPEPWSGVRNHVAKNNMLAMKKRDLAFFYHSSCKVPGVVGVMEIVEEATPDLSAFDSKDPYFDGKSDPKKPRWFNVHVQFRMKFPDPDKTTLTVLRSHAANGPLSNMALVKQSRLSVTKVTSEEWDFILDLAGVPEYKDKSVTST